METKKIKLNIMRLKLICISVVLIGSITIKTYGQTIDSLFVKNPEILELLDSYVIDSTKYDTFRKDFNLEGDIFNVKGNIGPFGECQPFFSKPNNVVSILYLNMGAKGGTLEEVLAGKNASGNVVLGYLHKNGNSVQYKDSPESFIVICKLSFKKDILISKMLLSKY